MKVLHVAGARPNFMKIAPLVRAFAARGADAPICHTGQHYDERMSRLFFEELGLPRPAVNLEVGSAGHAVQTARVLERFEELVAADRPDLVVVVGDVNSTLACALVCAKLRIPVAHVEAGLRSFDRDMPEEINRVVTDAISDLLYCSEPAGVENLRREGISGERVLFAGNVMIDTLLQHRERARQSDARERLAPGDRYGVVTLHRPSNVDVPDVAAGLVDALLEVSEDAPLLLPLHPRTRAAFTRHGLLRRLEDAPGMTVVEPLGYLEFLALLDGAALVFTDSGGIQEETTVLGVPCVTLRHNTERPVTVEQGTNRIAGTAAEDVVAAAREALVAPPRGSTPERWDGHAADRIAEHVLGGGPTAARTKMGTDPGDPIDE